MIEIRRAVLADVESLVAFNSAMALETEDKQLDRSVLEAGVKTLLQHAELGFYLVAVCRGGENDGELVGALMVTSEWSDWRNGLFWWIQSVYIKPDYRRQGIYRRLYRRVGELADQRGDVCGFRLYVEKENRRAQQAYRALGMRETDYLLFEQ